MSKELLIVWSIGNTGFTVFSVHRQECGKKSAKTENKPEYNCTTIMCFNRSVYVK